MRGLLLVARRELSAYLNSYMGYIIVPIFLCLQGLLFDILGMVGKKTSGEVLEWFFWAGFGCTAAAALFLSMRVVAEEKQTGTMVLIDSSPLSDWQVIGGKWLSVVTLLFFMQVLSAFMPAMIFINGKVSMGQILVGYSGVMLAGMACAAIGTFASTLSRYQIVSVLLGGGVVIFLVSSWILGKLSEPPLDAVFAYMSLFDRHFQPFQRGRINTEDVVFYLSITWVFLLLGTRVLSARRWR
jgi:ABC-2 type transport system permease protein